MPQRALYAVVPVKSLARAKTRLAPALSATERLKLARRFLHRTLALLAQHPGADRTIVVSADAAVLHFARSKGMIALPQTAQGGINRAVALGCRLAQTRGAKAVVVLPTDLPHLTLPSLRRFAHPGSKPTIRLAADRHDAGTNALYLQPPLCRFARFGEDSLRGHAAHARAVGIPAQIVRGRTLGFDVDMPADFRLLQRR